MVLGSQVTDAALAGTLDRTSYPRLAATLELIEKLTCDPSAISPADITPLRRAGIGDDEILDALVICAGFNIIDRVADALGFEEPDPGALRKGAKVLLTFGYKLSSGVILRAPRRYRGSRLEKYLEGFRDLKHSIWDGPGSLPANLRRSLSRGEGVPEPLLDYVRKVIQNATLVTDADIQSLEDAGYSEDQIFEATISAALGAGLDRLHAGLRALGVDGNLSPATGHAA